MKLRDLSSDEIARRLREEGIFLHTGPFVIRLQSQVPFVADDIRILYGAYEIGTEVEFADFHIALARPRGLRRWIRPQVLFLFDGYRPFVPFRLDQAFPLLEWGMNWCVANHSNQYLIIHAAVVERDGNCAIMAAPPGSGKSTLCAGLVKRGWRLFSDELALISSEKLALIPVPRPVSLKNASIDVMRRFAPDAVFGRPVYETNKGTVCHMQAPEDSVRRDGEPGIPRWVIFPKYAPGSPGKLKVRNKGAAFLELADNAFNYSHLGVRGFELLTSLMDQCEVYDFAYEDLDGAVEVFAGLAQSKVHAPVPATATA